MNAECQSVAGEKEAATLRRKMFGATILENSNQKLACSDTWARSEMEELNRVGAIEDCSHQ